MRKRLLTPILFFSIAAFSQQPGDLISVEKKMDDSKRQVIQRMASFGKIQVPNAVADLFKSLVKDLEAYKLTYWTTDHHDKLVKAHGLVMFPKVDYALSTVLLEHPTADKRVNVPSNLKSTREAAFIFDMLFAINGYYVVAPDYLGLGDSEGVHPYADAKTEASASIDMLTAADKFLKEKGAKRYDEYFVTGYSQGGHSTMSVLKYNAEKYKRFNFKQAYAGAGPYDLSKTTYEDYLLKIEDYPSSAFIAYIVNGANSIGYKQYEKSYKEIIAPEFQDLYKKHVIDEEGGLDWGPIKWRSMFTKEYITKATSPNNSLRDFLKQSDVYDFHNNTPTTMSYTTADKEIPYENALKTVSTQRGYYPSADLSKYKIKASNLGPLGHSTGIFPWAIAAIAKFNHNRSGGFFNTNAMIANKKNEQESSLVINKSHLHPQINKTANNSDFEITNIYGFDNNSTNKKINARKLEDLNEGAYIVEMKHEDKIFKIAYSKENSTKIPSDELIKENKEGKWSINRYGIENEEASIFIFNKENNLVYSNNFEKDQEIIIDYTNFKADQYTIELVTPSISLHTDALRKAMEVKNQLIISTYNEQITLKSNKEFNEVLITDLQGKILVQQNMSNGKDFTYPLAKSNSVIIAKVVYSNGDYETKKIIW